MAVQINGKTREIIEIEKGIDQITVEKICKNNNKLKDKIFNKSISKIFFVKDRIINFILKNEKFISTLVIGFLILISNSSCSYQKINSMDQKVFILKSSMWLAMQENHLLFKKIQRFSNKDSNNKIKLVIELKKRDNKGEKYTK